MKVPENIIITTKEYIQIQTQLTLFISVYGCKAVKQFLNTIPLKRIKKDGRNAGGYIVNKVCQEYNITQYDLFESVGRQELTEARQVLCVLIEKHLKFNKIQISLYFNRSRHFAKRMIGRFQKTLADNHELDAEVLKKYRKLDRLITAYMAFKPKNNE